MGLVTATSLRKPSPIELLLITYNARLAKWIPPKTAETIANQQRCIQ